MAEKHNEFLSRVRIEDNAFDKDSEEFVKLLLGQLEGAKKDMYARILAEWWQRRGFGDGSASTNPWPFVTGSTKE